MKDMTGDAKKRFFEANVAGLGAKLHFFEECVT